MYKVAVSLICVRDNPQILASQVYFWDHEQDELELMHSRKMYPPRFTLQVHGQSATHDAVALVQFRGDCVDLSTEIYLSLPTAGTKKYTVSSFVIHGSYIECVQSCTPFVIYYPSY